MMMHTSPRVSTATLIELEYWASRWLKRKPGSMRGLKSALRQFINEMQKKEK